MMTIVQLRETLEIHKVPAEIAEQILNDPEEWTEDDLEALFEQEDGQ
jgi:hypothetical protein